MDKFQEKLIKTAKEFHGRLLTLRVDTVEMPNGVVTTREIVGHPGAVAVVALTDDKELVLVRQFRRPSGEVLLELPAGVPQKDEKGELAAIRELEEETGYLAKSIKKVWEGYASPGYSNELISFYLAEDLTLTKTNPDEDEFVEVDIVDVESCLELVKHGQIRDNKTMVGVMIAVLYIRGEL